MTQQPEIALDNSGSLAIDAPCQRCNYNLRGMKADGTCAECGESIAWSLAEAARLNGPDDLTLDHMTLLGRAGYLLAGIVLPVVCFSIAFPKAIAGPDWQSGEWKDYLRLMLGGPPTWAFYPWLLLAMVSLLLVVIRPRRWGHKAWVRWGVYSGIPLAIQFIWFEANIISPGILSTLITLAIVTIVVGVVAGFNRVRRRIPLIFRRCFVWCVAGLSGVWWIIDAMGSPSFLGALGTPFVFLLVTATAWTLAAYALLSIRVVRTRTNEKIFWAWCALWLSGWASSWGVAIELALIEYAKLPTTPPTRCFIATAAAHGHARLVRSREMYPASGPPMRVNNQIRHLKAAEIALATVWPRGHRVCRGIYDVVGPRLAAGVTHPLVADMAYLALKPLELRLAQPGGHAHDHQGGPGEPGHLSLGGGHEEAGVSAGFGEGDAAV